MARLVRQSARCEHAATRAPARNPQGRAIAAELEQARERFLEGVAHFEADRLEQARACFEAALALAPGRASVLTNLGITLSRLQRWDEAIDALRRASAADAEQWDSWGALGQAHEARAHWRDAIGCLERALELNPDAPALWLSLARSRARVGLANAAIEAFDRALAREPALAPAWSERGSLLRELGRLDEAARSFEKAIESGADPELHRYYLASVRAGERPSAPPRRYVEALFDGYASEFSSHLVAGLRYQAPETLVGPLAHAGRRFGEVLDLGCGTGLCGSLIAPLADRIDGVDLSAAMLDEARRLGVYRDLVHGDLAQFLETTTQRVDLVIAADVFIYVGELSRVFSGVRRILRPGGCFALTVEAIGDEVDEAGYRLLPSLRYAHSEAYVRRLAAQSGFVVRHSFAAPLRRDQREDVAGLYCYLE